MITLSKLILILKTAISVEDIDKYRDEIIELIPVISIMIGYDQQNHAHQYDLWFHSLHTVLNLPRNIEDNMLYLAALLHDIGKPYCQTIDYKDGKINMHYYGHPLKSMEIVRDEVLPVILENTNLLFDDQRRLLYYVENHDDHVSLRPKHLRRHLNKGASVEEFQHLMLLEVADAKAHILLPIIQERIDICTILAGEKTIENYNYILYERI